MLKILVEASGSLTAAYLIKAIKEAGHKVVASDINPECAGRFLADDFIQMPSKDAPELWKDIYTKLTEHKINIVIPSLDETLLGWAERKSDLFKQGIHVVLSNDDVIHTFQDKWQTYQFFISIGINTPATSLQQSYPLIKPRNGRGSKGLRITDEPVCMNNMISQELITGEEYTIDVFCDKFSKPVYIVPRKRLGVKDGKSTAGIVVDSLEIVREVHKICESTHFFGPVNIQCFVCADDKSVKFIEVNPRIAGGMALAFAATENWVNLIIGHFIHGKKINPKPIKYGLKMMRYYAEIFVP